MNRAQTRAVATDGTTVAATVLFDAVSREKRPCPREPRGIVEPGKVPGSGLHRQLGMLEETGILGSAAAARRRTHRRATAPASKIVLLGVLRRHALGQPVELEQKVAELVETFRSELLSPGGLDLADGLSDHANRSDAAWSEGDALGAKVVGIRSTLEIAEPFELAEQVVQGLLADP